MDEQDRDAGRVSVLAHMQFDACRTFDRLNLHFMPSGFMNTTPNDLVRLLQFDLADLNNRLDDRVVWNVSHDCRCMRPECRLERVNRFKQQMFYCSIGWGLATSALKSIGPRNQLYAHESPLFSR